MRLFVIGVGQCGGRIADEFVRMDKHARKNTDSSFLVDAIAVNADMADLLVLKDIKKDSIHRLAIGLDRTGGHGTAKDADTGAMLMDIDAQSFLSTVRSTGTVSMADAFLLICGTGGGMGSGATPIIANILRDNFNKPILAFCVLPFAHEESIEERSSHNTAIALKTLDNSCEAVFVADNALFMRQNESLNENISAINKHYVSLFMNFVLNGGNRKANDGSLAVGELIYNLKGFCVLGRGQTILGGSGNSFQKRGMRVQNAIGALNSACGQTSCRLDLKNVSLLYLVANVDKKKFDDSMLNEVAESVKKSCPRANVVTAFKHNDNHNVVDISVLFVNNDLPIVNEYYSKGTEMQMRMDERERSRQEDRIRTDELAQDLPSLLDS